ncbi:MAG TPA: cytochrome c [Blastocatellia bacterium]|nr:cytochrome c [Blastocatellia bacterium]
MKRIALLALSVSLAMVMAFYIFTPQSAAAANGDARAGQEIHRKTCLRCHGELGKGDGPASKLLKTKPADWSDKAAMSKLSDDYLFKVITKGGDSVGKSKLMPAFGDKLSDQDVRNVIAFIRSLAR